LTVRCAPENCNEQRDMSTPQSASAIIQNSSTANHIRQSIPDIADTLQPTPDSSSLSSPTVIPVIHSGTIHAEFHSSEEPALMKRDNIRHPLGPRASFLTTARSDLSPHITSVLDARATMSSSLSTPSTQTNTRDMAHSVSMVVSSHEYSLVPPASDIDEHTSALGGRQGD